MRELRWAHGRPAGVQDGGHLRGGVRGQHAVPLLGLRDRSGARSPRWPRRRDRPKVIILGSGPNRIGQGIEFDYSCVHAALALRDAGYETVMINCNPETVSTDYDTSDRLYFEPLTIEDVLEVIAAEQLFGHRGRGDPDAGRADPAEAGAGTAGRRGDDPGHLAGRHRPGRGPRPVR